MAYGRIPPVSAASFFPPVEDSAWRVIVPPSYPTEGCRCCADDESPEWRAPGPRATYARRLCAPPLRASVPLASHGIAGFSSLIQVAKPLCSNISFPPGLPSAAPWSCS